MNKISNTNVLNVSEAPSGEASDGTKKATEPVSLASLGGIIAAFFASLCCIGPVVFAALGVGVGATGILASTAGFLKAFVPYRPFFIVVAFAAIGAGFYLVYRRPKTVCASDSQCMDTSKRSQSVFFLWMATALTLFFVSSPYWLGIFK